MIRTEGATFLELDEWIERLDQRMDRAMRSVMDEVADQLGRVTVAAGKPPPKRLPPPVPPPPPEAPPPGEPLVSLDTLGLIMTLWGVAVDEDGGIFELVKEVYVHGADSLARNASGARAKRELTEPAPEILESPTAEAYLAAAHNRMVRFSDQMWEIARAQLLEGFIEGESIDQLRDRLVSVAGLSEGRARNVARTEVVSASNAGSLAMVELAGFEGFKTWLATPDTRTRPTHVKADGDTVAMAEPFDVGGSPLQFPGDPTAPPEEIINCVVGSTHLAWPGQSAYASTRRGYRGALIKLTTANGHVLSVTPNHPILTSFGYRPAQAIRPFDEVYATSVPGPPNVSHVPPRADQFHGALCEAGISAGVIGSAVDFHGDGAESEIEIVRTDRYLCLNRYTATQCDTSEDLFIGLHETESRLPSVGHGGVLRKNYASEGLWAGSSAGDVRGIRDVASVLWCECCHSEEVGLAGAADSQPERLQSTDDGWSTDLEFIRHTKHALSLGMTLTQVIAVELDPFAHVDVYNLSTSDGWYIANGIASHNCRCTLTYDLDDEPDETGVREPVLTSAGDAMGTGEWIGVLTLEGRRTGDGRMFAPGAITWQDLPLPLLWQRMTDDGHKGSVIVGRIDAVTRVGDLIVGRGTFDLSTPEGNDAYGRLTRKYLDGVSVDADNFIAVDVEYLYGPGVDGDGDPVIELVVFHSARLRGATLCAMPAFIEARISAVPTIEGEDQMQAMIAAAIPSHDTATVDEPWDGPAAESRLPSPLPTATARAEYAWFDSDAVKDGVIAKSACKFPHHEVSAEGRPGAANLVACSAGIAALHGARGGADIPEDDRRGVYDHLARHLRDGGREVPEFSEDGALTAASYVLTIPDVPPAEWFGEPTDVDIRGALTVTDEGRVYGYLAPAGVAHRSFTKRVTVPMGNVDYSLYMGRETIVAGGARVVTGALTMDCGHASHAIQSGGAALDHYDNSCSIVATVRIGENASGVWVAGAIVPGVTASQLSRMMGCQLSGDWRPHRDRNGWREFAGALLVPVPGFAMTRSGASVRVEEETGALVACAVPVEYLPVATMTAAGSGCGCQTGESETVDVASAETVGELDLSGVANLIARSVGLDHGARAQAIAATVRGE